MTLCLNCGNTLKEGAKFCPKCGQKTDGAAAPAEPRARTESLWEEPIPAPRQDGPFSLNKYLFNQKVLSLPEQYYIFDEQGREIFFVRRKLFALKRHITFFFDHSMTREALKVEQKKLIEIFTKAYEVKTPDGQFVGRLKRIWFRSIFRRTWNIEGPGGEFIGRAEEDSWLLAFVRRHLFKGWKTDFIFTVGGREIGRFVRRITLVDKYVLELTPGTEGELDRRLALAVGVLLDAEEGR